MRYETLDQIPSNHYICNNSQQLTAQSDLDEYAVFFIIPAAVYRPMRECAVLEKLHHAKNIAITLKAGITSKIDGTGGFGAKHICEEKANHISIIHPYFKDSVQNSPLPTLSLIRCLDHCLSKMSKLSDPIYSENMALAWCEKENDGKFLYALQLDPENYFLIVLYPDGNTLSVCTAYFIPKQKFQKIKQGYENVYPILFSKQRSVINNENNNNNITLKTGIGEAILPAPSFFYKNIDRKAAQERKTIHIKSVKKKTKKAKHKTKKINTLPQFDLDAYIKCLPMHDTISQGLLNPSDISQDLRDTDPIARKMIRQNIYNKALENSYDYEQIKINTSKIIQTSINLNKHIAQLNQHKNDCDQFNAFFQKDENTSSLFEQFESIKSKMLDLNQASTNKKLMNSIIQRTESTRKKLKNLDCVIDKYKNKLESHMNDMQKTIDQHHKLVLDSLNRFFLLIVTFLDCNRKNHMNQEHLVHPGAKKAMQFQDMLQTLLTKTQMKQFFTTDLDALSVTLDLIIPTGGYNTNEIKETIKRITMHPSYIQFSGNYSTEIIHRLNTMIENMKDFHLQTQCLKAALLNLSPDQEEQHVQLLELAAEITDTQILSNTLDQMANTNDNTGSEDTDREDDNNNNNKKPKK